MPWKPRYSRNEAALAIARAKTWADALRILGVAAQGKNYATLRKWADRWELDTSHLPRAQRRGSPTGPRFSEKSLRSAIAASRSWSETLRRLGYRSAGGNWKTLKTYAAKWEIPTSHFDPRAASVEGLRSAARERRPLDEILVADSSYKRAHVKKRLFQEGLKERRCELCGQGEIWHGRVMALILDHVNGVPNDHRLENLRIVCPNCAATLATHCGRKNRKPPRACRACGASFYARNREQQFCSRECAQRAGRRKAAERRKVARPPLEQLLAEIEELGYLATGRKYGVSDNAVRKWARQYERERALDEGRNTDFAEIPRRTWPNRRDRKSAA